MHTIRNGYLKKIKKANSPRRDSVPGDCKTIVGQVYNIHKN